MYVSVVNQLASSYYAIKHSSHVFPQTVLPSEITSNGQWDTGIKLSCGPLITTFIPLSNLGYTLCEFKNKINRNNKDFKTIL